VDVDNFCKKKLALPIVTSIVFAIRNIVVNADTETCNRQGKYYFSLLDA